VRELSLLVVEELIKVGIPAVSVPPGSCFVMDKGRLIVENDETIRGLMHIGVMPILFGDVVVDRTNSFGICSGDQCMSYLASMYKPDRIVFVSDVDGLYSADPKADPDAKFIKEVKGHSVKYDSESSVTDVTGGIRGKIDEMLAMCEYTNECVLVNGTVPGRLEALLKGEEVVCTRVKK